MDRAGLLAAILCHSRTVETPKQRQTICTSLPCVYCSFGWHIGKCGVVTRYDLARSTSGHRTLLVEYSIDKIDICLHQVVAEEANIVARQFL